MPVAGLSMDKCWFRIKSDIGWDCRVWCKYHGWPVVALWCCWSCFRLHVLLLFSDNISQSRGDWWITWWLLTQATQVWFQLSLMGSGMESSKIFLMLQKTSHLSLHDKKNGIMHVGVSGVKYISVILILQIWNRNFFNSGSIVKYIDRTHILLWLLSLLATTLRLARIKWYW